MPIDWDRVAWVDGAAPPAGGRPRLVLWLGPDETERIADAGCLAQQVGQRATVVALLTGTVDAAERALANWTGATGDRLARYGAVDERRGARGEAPAWAVLDARGTVVWLGPATPTDEPAVQALEDHLAHRLDPAVERDLVELGEHSLRGPAREALRDELAAWRERAPWHPGVFEQQARLLSSVTPQDVTGERACVAAALAALAARPVDVARFLHAALHERRDLRPRLGENLAAIDALRAAHPNLRTVEWANYRAASVAGEHDAARRSAVRLVELCKDRPGELLRIARELRSDVAGGAPHALLRTADLALAFAGTVSKRAPGFAIERFRLLAGGLGDVDAARAELDRAAALLGDDLDGLNDLASELLADPELRERWRGAVIELCERARAAPDWPHPDLVFTQVRALRAAGRPADACALLDAALASRPPERFPAWKPFAQLRDRVADQLPARRDR